MIIFGFKTRAKGIGACRFDCPFCQQETIYLRVAYKRWFTLFFIPIFPYSTVGEVAMCNRCYAEISATAIIWPLEVAA